MLVEYRRRFELLVGGMSLVYRRQTCPIFFSVWNDDRETRFCVKWKHCHFARRSFPLTISSVVWTNCVVRCSMTPVMRVTSYVSKMAAHRPQRMFSAQEVVELVLQPDSDEEKDVVGAFSDSDMELWDSDDDYIPVHDDERLDVNEVFFTPYDTFWDYLSKKKKSVMKIKCKVKLPLKITLHSFYINLCHVCMLCGYFIFFAFFFKKATKSCDLRGRPGPLSCVSISPDHAGHQLQGVILPPTEGRVVIYDHYLFESLPRTKTKFTCLPLRFKLNFVRGNRAQYSKTRPELLKVSYGRAP